MIVFLLNISDNSWGTSLGVQGLRLPASSPEGVGSIPDWGNSFQFALQPKKKPPNNLLGNSLLVQWLELCTLTAKGPGFQPLVRELRSHKSCGVAKKWQRYPCAFAEVPRGILEHSLGTVGL